VQVKLMKGGLIFHDVEIIIEFGDAKETALAKPPAAKMIAINQVF